MDENIEEIKFEIQRGSERYSRNDYSLFYQKHIDDLMNDWGEECKNLLDGKIKSGDIDIDEIFEVLQILNDLDALEKLPKYLQGKIHKFIVAEKSPYMCENYHQQRKKIAEFMTTEIKNLNQSKKNLQIFIETLRSVLDNSFMKNELEKVLKVKEFANGKISAVNVAKLILKNDFKIVEYDVLKKIAPLILFEKANKKCKVRHDLLHYFEDIKITKKKCENIVILTLEKKVLTSCNLNIEFDLDVNEVHIVCNSLHVHGDLPANYRGKNIFVFAKIIRLHKKTLWDISGQDSMDYFTSDAGQDDQGNGKNGTNGKPGKSGGNCEIVCEEISNSELWTIQSNGRNGSNGQNGGDGKDGANGIDVQESDFQLLNTNVTNQNLFQVLNKFNLKTNVGTWRKTFYENKKEKCLEFLPMDEKCELLITVKGSKGKFGRLGGFGGLGGQGGFAGKLQIVCNNQGKLIFILYFIKYLLEILL